MKISTSTIVTPVYRRGRAWEAGMGGRHVMKTKSEDRGRGEVNTGEFPSRGDGTAQSDDGRVISV